MKYPKDISMADILGPWEDPDFDSGLIQRCKRAWNKPLEQLTNEELATFLRQNMGIAHVLPIARRRLEHKVDDGTEIYDGELADVVKKIQI